MNTLPLSFDDYQLKNESSIPFFVIERFSHFKMLVKGVVIKFEKFIEKPEFILKIVQFSVAIFSIFPKYDSFLIIPKTLSKDAKNTFTFLKGIKNFDSILNFKYSIKQIVLNISGMMLFIVSSLTFIDRFKLLNIQVAKVALSSIPVFGILPFGGLLSFSLIGLMGTVILLSCDKLRGLRNEKLHITNEKIVQWSAPLKLSQIQARQVRYQSKISLMEKENGEFKALILEGEKKEKNFALNPPRLYAFQKALEEIRNLLKKNEISLKKYEKKLSDWKNLESDIHLKNDHLRVFQQVKLAKWKKRLSTISVKNMTTFLSIANNSIIFSRQLLSVVSVAAGFGLFTPAAFINAGLDAIVAGIGIATYILDKRT